MVRQSILAQSYSEGQCLASDKKLDFLKLSGIYPYSHKAKEEAKGVGNQLDCQICSGELRQES